MSNHYHLMLETPEGNLAQIMRHINGAYTTYFNSKRKRSGHLFQGRYNAVVMDADEYATNLSRYIHLNPVRAKMVSGPGEYPWSSYLYYTSRKKAPAWLVTDVILGFFDRKTSPAKKKYADFVTSLLGQEYESPLNEVFASTILGSQSFVEWIQDKYLVSQKNDRNIPAMTDLTCRRSIKEILAAVNDVFSDDVNLARKAALFVCHRHSGRKLKEIGAHFNVGESAVSQVSRRFGAVVSEDRRLLKRIDKLTRELGLSNV